MDELSIKIKIADKEYPMKVQSQDEELLRAAGKILNEKIKFFKNQFKVDNKQDLLSMVAFDIVVSKLKLENQVEDSERFVSESLVKLNQLIEKGNQENGSEE